MTTLGQGCANVGGRTVAMSAHWFDPATAGSGYSIQTIGNYEFYAIFAYDAQGFPRFLAAEGVPANSNASASFPVYQTRGPCPTCTAQPITRITIGQLTRTLSAQGALTRLESQSTFTQGVPGQWTSNDNVINLDGQGRTQACTAP